VSTAGTGKPRRRSGRGEQPMVPPTEFTSYYGHSIVKPSPWQADIPAYLFLGGLAGGSALLGAGADLTGRRRLRRATRLTALGAITASMGALVHDLGRPSRAINMLRVAKPTSPMSVGTWILTAFGPCAGAAAAAELPQLLPRPVRGLAGKAARPAGLAAAALAPAVASYTAVLIADTATPTWHASYRELPFVFVGSASMASGGAAMIFTPADEAGPARRLAAGGALLDLAAGQRMESSMGVVAEPLSRGTPGTLMRTSKALAGIGLLSSVFARRSRAAGIVSGAAYVGSSACGRFGIFYAGQESARDPKYTVSPQRERLSHR
jgi:Polysulphide reductase, NrfD